MTSLRTSTRTPMSTGPGPWAMRCSRHMRSSQSAPRRPVATTVCPARISSTPPGPSTTTPSQRSSSTTTCVHAVRKRRSTPASSRWRSRRAYRARARSVPRWRSGQSTSFRPALMARRRISSTSGRGPAPSTRPSAPNARYTPSTSAMAACTASCPRRSGRSPPTSLDSESFPSENAPAPENPVVMRHGSQFTQEPPACLGHARSSTAKPLSTMVMRPAKPRSISAKAQKMPAGPAPTMTASVLRALMAPPSLRVRRGARALHRIVAHRRASGRTERGGATAPLASSPDAPARSRRAAAPRDSAGGKGVHGESLQDLWGRRALLVLVRRDSLPSLISGVAVSLPS